MRDASGMRTTLNLDDDVLETAKNLATVKRVSLSRVISDTMRDALGPPPGYQGGGEMGYCFFP